MNPNTCAIIPPSGEKSGLVSAVQQGEKICAIFYGHPGVFADVPHGAISKLRAAGYSARLEQTATLVLPPKKNLQADPQALQAPAYTASDLNGACLSQNSCHPGVCRDPESPTKRVTDGFWRTPTERVFFEADSA